MVEERFSILSFDLNFKQELSMAGIERPLLLLFSRFEFKSDFSKFVWTEFLLGPDGNIVLSVEL